jgi:AcrR family transcriptional regulator
MLKQLRSPGLRERKKQQTRQRIAQTAAGLFRRRGYENVRMVDIAQAADVSEQTLYNYFPTKEHLVFDMDRELEARILRVVLDRDPGVSLARALRAGALEFLEDIGRSIGKDTGVPASVATGPELRRVWVEMNARWADALADALIQQKKASLPRAGAKFVARSVVALFAVILEGVGEGAIKGKGRRAVRKKLTASIEFIFGQMDGGFKI